VGLAHHGHVASPDTKYVRTTDGVYIAYQVVGSGPADVVVGLHAYESNVDLIWDEPDWSPYLHGISSSARVIIHDRRGLGVSSRSVGPANLETQAADLLAVLDAVGSERPIFASSWFEAAVFVLFAATHPDRVTGLIWHQPRAKVAWAEDYPWGSRPDDLDFDLDAFATGWGSFAEARSLAELREKERLGLPPDAEPPHLSDEQINVYARMTRNSASPDVAREVARISYEIDIRALLPLVRAPTAMVVGTKDPPAAADEAAYVASLMPNATVHMIEGRAGAAVEPAVRLVRRLAGMAEPMASVDTVLATILFTDIVGSTSRQAAIGDAAWKQLLARHNDIVRAALRRWAGAERETTGDGFFATFEGPARAVRCATEVTAAVRSLGIEVRAGVHIGECELIGGKLTGVAISTCARIMAMAGASQVLVSQTVKDLAAGSGFSYADAGEHELKGLAGTWHLWAVGSGPS
jgi:class 3 adenylate cyclase